MNTKSTPASSAGREYVSPASRLIPFCLENAICGSPVPGGNEDIGYEDWE